MICFYCLVFYIFVVNMCVMEKVWDLLVDVIIFDLEDVVVLLEKVFVCDLLMVVLLVDYGNWVCIVWMNGLDMEWGEGDVCVFVCSVDVVLIFKVSCVVDLDWVVDLVFDVLFWVMMEIVEGMFNVYEIVLYLWLQVMVMGMNDLVKELGVCFWFDCLLLMVGLGMCVLVVKVYGFVIIDGVFNVFKDEDGLCVECEQGCDMGFDGKMLIYFVQFVVVNVVFVLIEVEIELVCCQIDVFVEVKVQGKGVVVVDGCIVENLYVEIVCVIIVKVEVIVRMVGQVQVVFECIQ